MFYFKDFFFLSKNESSQNLIVLYIINFYELFNLKQNAYKYVQYFRRKTAFIYLILYIQKKLTQNNVHSYYSFDIYKYFIKISKKKLL